MNKSKSGWYYRDKDGGKLRYVSICETPRFLCDGIWLVQTLENGHKEQRIQMLGEIGPVFPYAQMMQDSDDLASFIRLWNGAKRSNEIEKHAKAQTPIDQLVMTIPSVSEQASDTLKFLAMDKKARGKWLKKLSSQSLSRTLAFKPYGSGLDGYNIVDDSGHIVRKATEWDCKVYSL